MMIKMNKILKNQIFYWMPVYIYMVLIFYFSSQSSIVVGGKIISGGYIVPYLVHLLEYSILSLLILRAAENSKFNTNPILWTVTVSSLYGISDEVHQYFVPGRTFGLVDILFDLIGIFMGIIFYKLLLKIKFAKKLF